MIGGPGRRHASVVAMHAFLAQMLVLSPDTGPTNGATAVPRAGWKNSKLRATYLTDL